jgi:hypothetical protein
MPGVRETKIDTFAVELKRDEVRQAVVDAARIELTRGPGGYREADGRFDPQIVEDGYGGMTVYFRAAEIVTKSEAA